MTVVMTEQPTGKQASVCFSRELQMLNKANVESDQRKLQLQIGFQSQGVRMVSCGGTLIFRQDYVALATVVAQSALPIVDMGKHLGLTHEVVPMGGYFPQVAAFLYPLRLVVVRERE